MYYPEEVIAEVRSRNDIVDVVSSYVSLKKRGSNYIGLCPFHNEKTPSFNVNPARQIFHCFGCQEGGNVISFVMKYENCSFPEAVQMLAGRAGVTLPVREETEQDRQRASKRARLLEVNKEAATYFYGCLRSHRGEHGMAYLQKRELTQDTMRAFGLGYAGINGKEVVEYLRSKGFSDEEIREAGIASFSEKHGLSSMFWNRVMFPIFDNSHRVIGFGGRVMGDGEPKYLNTSDTPIFDKRRNLYGFDKARVSRKGNIILCEGYMDVISMHQAGFNQAVASLGTAFTEEQAQILKRTTDKVLLAYDSDGAGVKAALRALGLLRGVGLSGRVINLKPYKDPDEFMKNLGAEEFEKRIEEAENGVMFEARILSEQYDQSDPEQRTEFHRKLAEKLCELETGAERDNYTQAIAAKYHIDVGNLKELIIRHAAGPGQGVRIQRAEKAAGRKKETDSSLVASQKLLLTWVTEEPELYPVIAKYLRTEDFDEGVPRRLAELIFSGLEKGDFDPAAILDAFEDEEESREAAAVLQARLPENPSPEERDRTFSEIVYHIKEAAYQHFIADSGGAADAFQETIRRKQELEQLKRNPIRLR